MKKMKIEKLELSEKKVKKILDNVNDFCDSVESEYQDDRDIEIVSELKKIKTSKEDDGKATKEKAIQYMYEHSICFIPTNKVKAKCPISSKFISNLIAIFKNQRIKNSPFSRNRENYWVCTQFLQFKMQRKLLHNTSICT